MKSINEYINEAKTKKDIFTIHVFNVTNDEGVDEFKYSSQTYYSEDSAIKAARKCAKEFVGDDDVIQVGVCSGEYEDGNGNVYGEPDEIYTISNKDEKTTKEARKKSGYTRLDVDEYLG